MRSRCLHEGKTAWGCRVWAPGSRVSMLPGVISSATPCCMQHSIGQPGMTDFAAVLHPHYVLQQDLSDFVFTVILKIAFIEITCYMHFLGVELQHWPVASWLGWFENQRICFQSWKEAAEVPSLHWSSDSTAALSAACAFEVPVPHVGVQWVTLKGKSDETASRTCCYMWYLSGIYQNRKEIPDLGSGTLLQKR